MTKVERLEKRLEEISGAEKGWIPPWLRAVGSREEIAEWKAIYQVRRGLDRREREREFIHEMRKKHPNMPLSFEEQLERGAKRLQANPWLSWVRGIGRVLGADSVVGKIMAQLSVEERIHLSKAIRAFDEADAAPDAILTASLADLPGEQRTVIEKVRRLSRENEHGGE
jgi:hypothetical protein